MFRLFLLIIVSVGRLWLVISIGLCLSFFSEVFIVVEVGVMDGVCVFDGVWLMDMLRYLSNIVLSSSRLVRVISILLFMGRFLLCVWIGWWMENYWWLLMNEKEKVVFCCLCYGYILGLVFYGRYIGLLIGDSCYLRIKVYNFDYVVIGLNLDLG